MRTLANHINEALKIGKNISKFSTYSYKPKTKEELKKIVNERIDKDDLDCDLNDIDTSLITDMSGLFYDSVFNGNISYWDVSNVTNMSHMFMKSKFNQDISNWKINKNCDTYNIFCECPINKEYKPKLPR